MSREEDIENRKYLYGIIEQAVENANQEIRNQFEEIIRQQASIDAIDTISTFIKKSIPDLIYEQSECHLSFIVEGYCQTVVERLKPRIIEFIEGKPSLCEGTDNLWHEFCDLIQSDCDFYYSGCAEVPAVQEAIEEAIEEYFTENRINPTDAYAIHWVYGINDVYNVSDENDQLFMPKPTFNELCEDFFEILERWAVDFDIEKYEEHEEYEEDEYEEYENDDEDVGSLDDTEYYQYTLKDLFTDCEN